MRSQPPPEHRPRRLNSHDDPRATQQRSHPLANDRPRWAAGYDDDRRPLAQQRRHNPAPTRPEQSRPRDERTTQRTTRVPRRDDEPRNENEATRRRWWPVLGPLALLAIGISLAIPAGRHQWAVSIFRQPTPYTELAFDDAANLPKTASPNKPINVSFSIENNEGETVDYHYVVSESPAGKSKVLASGVKTITTGTASTIPVTVRPACPSSPCKVEVSLPGYPEKIDFLVNLAG